MTSTRVALLAVLTCVPPLVAPLRAATWPAWLYGKGALTQANDAADAHDFARARALLMELERGATEPDAQVDLAWARVLQAEGDLPGALDRLRRAAALDPRSDARVLLAALLTGLGRNPEATVELGLAFDERGDDLPVAVAFDDPRFAALRNEPRFVEMVERVRNDREGWLGRLRTRVERVEASAERIELLLVRVDVATSWVLALPYNKGAVFLTVVLLAFLIGSGVNLMRLVSPRIALALGWLAAAALVAATLNLLPTGGGEDLPRRGLGPIALSGAITLGPVLVHAGVKRLLRARSSGSAAGA